MTPRGRGLLLAVVALCFLVLTGATALLVRQAVRTESKIQVSEGSKPTNNPDAEVAAVGERVVLRQQEDSPQRVASLDFTPPPLEPMATLPMGKLPKLGRWLVRGTDDYGIQWQAALVFVKNIDESTNAGYFDWNAPGASGREHFRGTFDKTSRKIRWTGDRIENARGNIVHANYEATVSDDGLKLTKGRWSGNGSIPGRWTADWKADEK